MDDLTPLQQQGLQRLKHRLETLTSLVELNAPHYVIANSVLLVQEAAKQLCKDDYYKALQNRERDSMLMMLGLCNECEQPVSEDGQHFRLCKKHFEELLEEEREELEGELKREFGEDLGNFKPS